jgi:hypothetical protein
MPLALLFDLEPGMTETVCALPLCEFFRPENPVKLNAGAGNN